MGNKRIIKGVKRFIKTKDFKWCIGITLMMLIWVGIAPTFYKVITTGSKGIWLKRIYLLFDQNIWLFIPVLVSLTFVFWRLLKLLKKSIPSKPFQVHWLFTIAFGFVVLYCQPPFDYAIIVWKIDYRHFFSAWLVIVSISCTLFWMIKPFVEKVRNNPQDWHEIVPGFSLDNNRVIQHTDPVKLYADLIVEKLINTKFSKDESFAIGITSEWGAGKTTFLDLLSDKITKEGFAEVVPFNPWMCQSPEQVTRDFFSSLRHQLSDKYPQLSNPIKKYARCLGAISVPAHRIAKIEFTNLATEKSLYKMKLELSERFSELDKRVVVTIDDLDRLDSDEVFEVLRLIRNTASLSNVVYLVAYDKSYIVKVLENKNISSPSAYLEKIFQLEIQLPIVQEGQVWKVFVDDLRDQLSKTDDISFVSRDKELVEEVLNTYRRAKRFARLLSLSYHYHSSKKSLHELDKNDILLLDLLHMDDKNVYDLLSFKPEKILELNNGMWIYNKERDNEQKIVLADGSKLKVKETSDKILRRLWGQDDSEPGKYSIRREEFLEEYFTLNVQFSNKDIKAMIDSDDVDALVTGWYNSGKSLEGITNKINSYAKEGLTKQQRTNLVLGILSYCCMRDSFSILTEIDKMALGLIGNHGILYKWFVMKMDQNCNYIDLSSIAGRIVRIGLFNEKESKGLIEKMVDKLFENKENRVQSILDMLSFSYLSEFLTNLSFFGNQQLARIAFNRIVFICHNETNKPTIDTFCSEYNKNKSDDENPALKRVFHDDWEKTLCILFNNCIDQTGIIDEKDKASNSIIEWIKKDTKEFSEECFNSGGGYFDEGVFDLAVENYTEAIRLKPDYAMAYINRGVAYFMMDKNDKAIADETEAIKIRPDYEKAYYNRGLAYSRRNENDKAIEDYSKAIKIRQDFAEAYNNRGLSYSKLGETEGAIADYTEAIKIRQDFAEAYNNRGFEYYKKGENKKAIADYMQAIRLRPDYAEAYNNRGLSYCMLWEDQKAIADCTEAINLRPDYAEAYCNRGWTYYGMRNDDIAIADYTEAIRIKPDYAEAYYKLACALCRQKEYEKALPYANKAVELNPNDVYYYDTRRDVYMGLEQWNKAIQDAKKTIELCETIERLVRMRQILDALKAPNDNNNNK